MKNLKQSANNLYVTFRIFFWIAVFGAAVVAVCLGMMIVKSELFLGDTLTFGPLSLSLNTEKVNVQSVEFHLIRIMEAVNMLLGLTVVAFFSKKMSDILKPIKNGMPFLNTVGEGIRTLANTVIVYAILKIAVDFANAFVFGMFLKEYELLFQNEYIQAADIQITTEVSWVILALVLKLVAYIFDYGRQLQELSDETL